MSSRRRRKSRERAHRTAAQWLARLKGNDGNAAAHLPPDFMLWVFAGLLAHLDRRGDANLADLDLSRGRRQDRSAWEMLDKVEAAYTGFCVGLKPDGTESDRDYLDEELGRLGQKNLSDSAIRRKFTANLRRRLLRAALDEVARRQLPARATKHQVRQRGDEIRRRLQGAGLLKLVGGSVPFITA